MTSRDNIPNIIISDLFKSFKFLIWSFLVTPNITLFVSQSIYAAPKTTPNVANIATK